MTCVPHRERKKERKREEAEEEGGDRRWKDWLYFCHNPSFLSKQTEMGKHHFKEVRLISLSVAFVAFHVLSAALTSPVTGDPRETLYARLYVFCGRSRRWSCVGFLPDSTMSHEGHKSKLLWGLCNGTVRVVMESRGGDGFDSACVLSSCWCWCGCWWPGGQADGPSNTGPGSKPAVSANIQLAEVSLKEKSTWKNIF